MQLSSRSTDDVLLLVARGTDLPVGVSPLAESGRGAIWNLGNGAFCSFRGCPMTKPAVQQKKRTAIAHDASSISHPVVNL